MIYDYFRVTDAHHTVLDHADLFSLTLRNDDVQEFDTRWDEILLSMTRTPPDDVLESLYKLRVRKSHHFKSVFKLNDMEILQEISMPNYQKLKTMVKRRKDQNLRLRNFDAKHWKIESGAVIKFERDCQALTEEMVSVTSGKKKANVRQETVAVSATKPKIVRKNQNTLPPRLLGQPHHEVEVCRGQRSLRSKSNHGAIL